MRIKYVLQSVFLLAAVSMAAAAINFLFFTPRGSSMLARRVLGYYIDSRTITIGTIEGTLAGGLSFRDVEIKNMNKLPAGAQMKIAALSISVQAPSLSGIAVEIENGRLNFPGSDTIIFYGNLRRGSFDIKLYGKYVGVKEILNLVSESPAVKNVGGRIRDLDAVFAGPLFGPRVRGTFYIEALSGTTFEAYASAGVFDLELRGRRPPRLYGYARANGGTVYLHKQNLTIAAESCQINYQGNFREPAVDCRGTTAVKVKDADVRITIVLQGSLELPELQLASNPPYSQEELMVMLATGTNWADTRTGLTSGQVNNAELVKDFVDYFLFAGEGRKFSQMLGISISDLRYDDEKRKVEVLKELDGRTAVHVGVEQKNAQNQVPQLTHSVGVSSKVADDKRISIEAESVMSTVNGTGAKPDQKVQIEFKKQF
ncbi:MAG: translocation/assembly module TamB [Candidatus Omnitrophica bacterium]|nr:translocation/assembly module TamB [Candidatus Omnitrophota bacterium]